jgi:hypothetical protein
VDSVSHSIILPRMSPLEFQMEPTTSNRDDGSADCNGHPGGDTAALLEMNMQHTEQALRIVEAELQIAIQHQGHTLGAIGQRVALLKNRVIDEEEKQSQRGVSCPLCSAEQLYSEREKCN